MWRTFSTHKLFQCILVRGLRFEHIKNDWKILAFLIQWYLRRFQRHQSYFHLLSFYLTIFTFKRCDFSFLTNLIKLGWNCSSDYWESLQTNEARHQVNRKVHMSWYIRGRENAIQVCSYGEHSIIKHSKDIIMQQSIFYYIYLIRYFDYHRNKATIEQIYNITAYTVHDTVNI